MSDTEKITYFAEADFRNRRTRFGIKSEDRTRHVYVIGKTGMGKSTLLENMAVQDIKNGEGMAFIDPHGKTADLFLDYIPEERLNDVVYFAPFDTDNPISFNIMEDVDPDRRHLVVSGLMSAFKKIWVDAWSARMEYILGNVLFALLEYPGATLLGVNRMMIDKEYRKKVVDNIKDPSVKSFWVDEFAKYTDRYTQDATPAIQNKVGQFTSNPLIRNIVGQPKSSFDIRKLMDEKKILIINLSKGRIGEDNANLLGSMLITKIYLAAMSRADLPETESKKLPNFYLYVDEFQSFANESFADILSEARKYKLNLTMAHQYIEQMSDEVRAAVFGNVGTMIMFRVGAFDAEVLEKEFMPVFTAEDMVNLGFAQIYLKLMIDGVSSHPFSAVTLSPIEPPKNSSKDAVVEASRKNYAQIRVEVEGAINKWYEPIEPTPKPRKEASITNKPERNTKGQIITSPASYRTQDVGARDNRREPAQVQQKNKPFKGVLPTPSTKKPYEHKEVVSRPVKRKPEGVSLNTLKKNDEKGPSPENKNQLRDALAGVLAGATADGALEPKPKEEPTPTPQNEGPGPDLSVGAKSVGEEKPKEPKKKEDKSEQIKEKPKEQKKPEPKKREPSTVENEIPEGVLKDMFNVDKPR